MEESDEEAESEEGEGKFELFEEELRESLQKVIVIDIHEYY